MNNATTNYQAVRAAAEARKTLAARLRATPTDDVTRVYFNEAADAIDHLHAEIARIRREAIEEQREFQREARDMAAEARWQAQADAEGRAAYGY